MAGESKKGAVGERRLISADLEDLRIKTTCWAFGHWAVDLPRNQGRKAWRHSWESHLHEEYYGKEVNKTCWRPTCARQWALGGTWAVIILHKLQVPCHLIQSATLGSRHLSPHFKTDAQRSFLNSFTYPNLLNSCYVSALWHPLGIWRWMRHTPWFWGTRGQSSPIRGVKHISSKITRYCSENVVLVSFNLSGSAVLQQK